MTSKTVLLVLLCLPAISLTQGFCSTGSTRASGCASCATAAADSDCDYCGSGYWKSGAKTCTACPNGTGRTTPTATTAIETAAVCTTKSAPQLKCAIAESRYSCATCPTGSYLEAGGIFEEIQVVGCSTDCKSFYNKLTGFKLVPAADTLPQTECIRCDSNCARCEFTTTLKGCAGSSAFCAVGATKQRTTCTECSNGYYLLPDKDEPTAVVPSCASCGANCKKCKDSTECTECWGGWALDGADKANCLKAVSVSASILQAAILSILAVSIAW